jgi:hypothetical protein
MADSAFDRTSRRVVYASRAGCALDSDLASGGGTDDASKAQAALDALGSTGGGAFVIDGPMLIGTPLKAWSNTEIFGVGPGGLFLDTGIAGCAIRNKHWVSSYNGGGTPVYDGSSIVDHDIDVHDLYVNGNRAGFASGNFADARVDSSGRVMCGMQFYGVKRLRLESVQIYDTTFGVHLANVFDSTIRNVRVDDPQALSGGPINTRLTVNTQVQGPADNLTIDTLTGATSDDFLALNAADVNLAPSWFLGGATTVTPASNFYWGYASVYQGPITRVNARNIYPTTTLSALRIHSNFNYPSTTNLVDQIDVSGVRGSVTLHAGILNNFLGGVSVSTPPGETNGTGSGNFGRITLRDWDVDLSGSSDGYLVVGGNHRRLRILDHARRNLNGSNNAIVFDPNSNVDHVRISLDVDEQSAPAAATPLVDLTGGTIGHLQVERLNWRRAAALSVAATGAVRVQAGTVGLLTIGHAEVGRVRNLVDFAGGTLSAVHAGQVVHLAGGSAGSFRIGNGLALPLLWVADWDGTAIRELVGTGAITTTRGAGFYSGVPVLP